MEREGFTGSGRAQDASTALNSVAPGTHALIQDGVDLLTRRVEPGGLTASVAIATGAAYTTSLARRVSSGRGGATPAK